MSIDDIFPEDALFHFVAILGDDFLEGPERIESFRRAAASRVRGLEVARDDWAVSESPPCTYGSVGHAGWHWRVAIMLCPVPEGGGQTLIFAGGPPTPHAAHAFVFLTQAPPNAAPLGRVRRSTALGSAFLDAGALALSFPGGGRLHGREALAAIELQSCADEDLTWAILDKAAVGEDDRGRPWVRTFGMAQLGLADVAAPGAEDAVDELLVPLPAYLAKLGRDLAPGEDVGGTWRAGGQGDLPALEALEGCTPILPK